MDQNYIPSMRVSHPAPTSGASAYAQTMSSSPSLYHSRTIPEIPSTGRRHSEFPSNNVDQTYGQVYRRISNPYDASSTQYSMLSGQNIPSISGQTQSPHPSPHPGSVPGTTVNTSYHAGVQRSVTLPKHGSG